VTRAVWIDDARFELSPARLVGQGGEAEIFDLGDGRVVKWWKPEDHPDYDGMPDARAAAAERLVERPARLRALPGRLPAAVVAPCGLALASRRSQRVVGFVMPKIAGTALYAYGEPRWRRDHAIANADVVAILLALHDAIAELHRAGVVIGDCNDLNVLVDHSAPPFGAAAGRAQVPASGDRRVHLIDVDSYQLPGFPCAMFSERFVDPRLTDGTTLVPTRPHDTDSDWFAFAAMALRSLLGVGPWGGVLASCPASQRALRRLSVLGAGVVYPRAARPLATLPDFALDTFRAIFERDARGVFSRDVLARLRFVRCASCGDEHARTTCPTCSAPARPAPAIIHGRLRHHMVALADVELGALAVTRTPVRNVWLDGAALYRATRVGPERIGSVLAGLTRAWVGRELGVGFYRAGGYAVGFVFRPDRGVLDDRVVLPKLRGELVDARAAISDDRAWLFVTLADAGRLVTHAIVISADARVLAAEELDADAPWLAGIAGACAIGAHLFVPTDDGVARVEVSPAGAIVQTRVFAETAELVTAGDRLAPHAAGLDAIRRRDAIRMHLT
jgi:hypothetical protein